MAGIARMVGRIGSSDIVFYSKDGDWVATVPPGLYGEFIIEVTAFDQAGNTAYSTSMLFVIDPSDLSFKVIPLSFAYKVDEGGFTEREIQSDYAFYVV